MTFAPSSHIAHYRVLSKLGAGGGGEVFRCVDERSNREVAVKVMPDAQLHDAGAIARFRREARVGLGLSHPHICAVYDAGAFEGRDYIVMELLHGSPLSLLIAARPLPLDRLLELAIQVVDALDAAHEREIVHRDVKPANIFVTRDGLVKLLDFGVARSTETSPGERASLTGERTIVGTPTHMAPERILGAAADVRADVFSLGVTLFQMATARLPFPGVTLVEVLTRVLHDAPPAPSSLDPELPAAFDRVVLRALEKAPERRYQDMATLRDDLVDLRLRSARPSADAHPDRDWADTPTSPLHAWPVQNAFLVEPWDAVARDSRDFAERGAGVMHWFGVPLGAISYPDGFRSAMLPALENRLVTELRFVLDAASPGVRAAWTAHVLPQVALWSKRRGQGVEARDDEARGAIVRRDGRALISWTFRDLSLEFGPAFKLFVDDAPGATIDAQVYIATSPREVSGLDGRVAHVGVPETVMRVRGEASAPLLAALLRRTHAPHCPPRGAINSR